MFKGLKIPGLLEEETFSNSFYEATITWNQNQTKTIHKKENYRAISLMNIDTKLLNKILVNKIQKAHTP